MKGRTLDLRLRATARAVLCLVLVLLLPSRNLFATGVFWTGGLGNWSNPSNWNTLQIPQMMQDVLINSGSAFGDAVTLDNTAQTVHTVVNSLTVGGGPMASILSTAGSGVTLKIGRAHV